MKKKGFTVVELLVVVAIIVTLMAILLPNLAAALERARQATCAANLRSIGQSIKVYSSGNRGRWPTVFNDDSTDWGESAWDDENTLITDFQEDVEPENLDVFTCNLSCLYILIRKGMSKPGVFICPSSDQEEDTELDDPEDVYSFRDLKHVSYSYQNQIGGATTDSVDADLVVAADMNPLRPDMEMEKSTRAEDRNKDNRCELNSPNHDFEGQNCLYADGHVLWQTTPYQGIGRNNIWVASEYDPENDPPWEEDEDDSSYDFTSPKANRKDTFLVP
jgi:prepilin-type N-terminal cleavage/methylation domain-containing protein